MIYKKVKFPLFFFAMAKKRKAAESMGSTTGADPAGTTGIAGIAQYRVVGVPKIQVGTSNIWLVLIRCYRLGKKIPTSPDFIDDI